MPLNLHIPLPGPVAYNRRLGGAPGGAGCGFLLLLLCLGWLIQHWVIALCGFAAVLAICYVRGRPDQ